MRCGATPSRCTDATAFAVATAASTARRRSAPGSSLSWDHLLPKGHANRDNVDYIVISCVFCNTADNRYFGQALKRGLQFDGLTPDQLVAQRLPYVERTRERYRAFWTEHVAAESPTE